MYQCTDPTRTISDIKWKITNGRKGKYFKKKVSDNIICLDTETTSAFICEDGNGYPEVFDYDAPERFKTSEHVALCYLWGVSVDDLIFYGRELKDLPKFFEDLHAACPADIMIIYVHNLPFDFTFLQNVLNFDNVFARTPHKPMCAGLKKYGIELRDSYVLTQMSLASWAINEKLPVQKLKGDLDYHKIRTPLTALTVKERGYFTADLMVMYEGLKKYRNKYHHINRIPLTLTGEMRFECEKVMRNQWSYCRLCTRMLPESIEEYSRSIMAFMGGTCLCNWLYKNRVIDFVEMWDIASSYPWQMLSLSVPMSRFIKTKHYDKYMNNERYVYLIQFECTNVYSKLNCHFLSGSKALKKVGYRLDNGRIIEAEYLQVQLTSIDFEIFKQCYTYEDFNIIDFRFAKAGRLNNEFRKFILKLYNDKTSLKGVNDELYAKSKKLINSGYGDLVTRIISDDVIYDKGKWNKKYLTAASFDDKVEKIRKKEYKNYKSFNHGLFITAGARAALWTGIIALDEYMVYTDTDSLKVHTHDRTFFEEYNKKILKRHEELAEELKVPVEMFRPKTPKGVEKPIGIFEYEGCEKIKSLGAKQYMTQDDEGNFHLTCAGLSKRAVKLFTSFDDFRTDRRITEKELHDIVDNNGVHVAEKNTSFYLSDQKPIVWPDGYVSTDRFGVCLMPTTFNLNITPNDMKLLLNEVLDIRTKIFNKPLF